MQMIEIKLKMEGVLCIIIVLGLNPQKSENLDLLLSGNFRKYLQDIWPNFKMASTFKHVCLHDYVGYYIVIVNFLELLSVKSHCRKAILNYFRSQVFIYKNAAIFEDGRK